MTRYKVRNWLLAHSFPQGRGPFKQRIQQYPQCTKFRPYHREVVETRVNIEFVNLLKLTKFGFVEETEDSPGLRPKQADLWSKLGGWELSAKSPSIVGSTPTKSSICLNSLVGLKHLAHIQKINGSNPFSDTNGGVAQSVEHLTCLSNLNEKEE